MCKCSPLHVERYLAKISGPLLDRIAIHIFVRPVEIESFEKRTPENKREAMVAAVRKAREFQYERSDREGTPFVTNARLPEGRARVYCRLRPDGTRLLRNAQKRFRISARGRSHVLRVSRTIADLEQSSAITAEHVAEALHYRIKELPV